VLSYWQSLSQQQRNVYGWLAWSIGVVAFPVGGLLVPRGSDYLALAIDIPGPLGLVIWAIWGIAFVFMALGMQILRATSLKRVIFAQLAGGIIVAVLTLAVPTQDPYAYALYGRWQATGIDPWNPPPLTGTAPDAALLNAIFSTNPLPSVYGPMFVGLESALYWLAPHGSLSTWALIHRALMLPMAVIVTILVRGPRIAYWALNPLVMFEFAICGHNDALMLAFVAVAMRLPWKWAKGIAIGCAGMIKFPALLVALFWRRWQTLVGLGGTLIVFRLLYPGAFSLRPLLSQSTYSVGSPRGMIEKMLGPVHLLHSDIIALVAVVLLTILVLFFCSAGISRRNAAAAGCMALFAVSPVLHSWYLTWPLMCTAWISPKLRMLILAASLLAWTLELGTISPIALHLSSVAFWGPIVALTAYLYLPRLRRARVE
jgi:hypothetical protein